VTGVEDVDEAVRGPVLSDRLVALLAESPRPSPAVVAELVRSTCAVDHVALVEINSDACSVTATAGLNLLKAGTTAQPAVSSRLVAVSAGQVWSSADVSEEPGFDRPIDQLHLTLGIRAGAGVPLAVRGETVGAVLLSCTARGRDWSPVVAGIAECAGLLAAALGFGRAAGEMLRVAVVYPDPLAAQAWPGSLIAGCPQRSRSPAEHGIPGLRRCSHTRTWSSSARRSPGRKAPAASSSCTTAPDPRPGAQTWCSETMPSRRW
jgi:hypothetical protein